MPSFALRMRGTGGGFSMGSLEEVQTYRFSRSASIVGVQEKLLAELGGALDMA